LESNVKSHLEQIRSRKDQQPKNFFLEDLVEKKAKILSQGLVKLRGAFSTRSFQDLMDWVCIRFLQEYWYLAFLTRILGGFNRDLTRNYKIQFLNAL
jgi:hypothetical protein